MKYLIAPAIAWLIAQSLKQLFRLMGRNRRIFGGQARSMLMLSGGMPSAHAAFVVSFALSMGLSEGWSSPLFAFAMVFASIVIYDSVMVRYSSGQQGETLNRLIVEKKSKLLPIRVAHGHTLVEAVAGSIIGATVALVVFFATN